MFKAFESSVAKFAQSLRLSTDSTTQPGWKFFRHTKYNRLFGWQRRLGGNIPTSPTSKTLLAFRPAFSKSIKKQKKTLSSDFWAAVFAPQISLPYRKSVAFCFDFVSYHLVWSAEFDNTSNWRWACVALHNTMYKSSAHNMCNMILLDIQIPHIYSRLNSPKWCG